MVLALVEDLIFLSKIQETAKILGVTVQTTSPSVIEAQARANPGCGLLVDLNHRSGDVLAQIQSLKSDPASALIRVVGFLSHVQTDLAASARAAGCDMVLARSAFVKQLPEFLKKLDGQ